jgi:hypothetical protein
MSRTRDRALAGAGFMFAFPIVRFVVRLTSTLNKKTSRWWEAPEILLVLACCVQALPTVIAPPIMTRRITITRRTF